MFIRAIFYFSVFCIGLYMVCMFLALDWLGTISTWPEGSWYHVYGKWLVGTLAGSLVLALIGITLTIRLEGKNKRR